MLHEELDALMARLAAGDRGAFASVFELLWAPVHRLCVGVLKNEADAADAAQDALLKVFERAADYDRTRRALPWIMAIAGWQCRTVMRKRGRSREVPDARGAERVAASSTESEESFVQRDLLDAVMTSVGTLADADREALIATYWDEAASVSGATLRKRRQRALTRLRDTFRRLYGLD